ncbi:ABC transporter ATP-binding protein [Arthrobacter sp. Z1-15]
MLRIDSVSKCYGAAQILNDVSLEVGEGEICGFVGGNGAGKTTTMRIAMGVTNSDQGAVYWRGKPVDSDARQTFGYMPEERGLYPKMALAEQLEYFAELHGLTRLDARRESKQWLDRLGLAERAKDHVEALSLGNQQRMQLATALVFKPDLLVLDEPFSGLDPLAVDVMSEVIAEQAAGGTAVLFSSHQLELVERVCTRLAVISKGRILLHDTVEQIREAAGSRLVVEGDAGMWTWPNNVADLRILEWTDKMVVIDTQSVKDHDHLVRRASSDGGILSIRTEQPSLTEIYRSLMEHRQDGLSAENIHRGEIVK